MSDIFISYASEDRPRARMLAKTLEARGWSVWWDRTIPAGSNFDDVIESALEEAKCVVVIWSTHSVGSRWVRTEAAEGAERGILIPVLVEDTQIPLAFRRLHTENLTDWDGTVTETFHKLTIDISNVLGAPAVEVKQANGTLVERKGKGKENFKSLEKQRVEIVPREQATHEDRTTFPNTTTLLAIFTTSVVSALALGTLFSFAYPTVGIDFGLVSLFILIGLTIALTVHGVCRLIRHKRK